MRALRVTLRGDVPICEGESRTRDVRVSDAAVVVVSDPSAGPAGVVEAFSLEGVQAVELLRQTGQAQRAGS